MSAGSPPAASTLKRRPPLAYTMTPCVLHDPAPPLLPGPRRTWGGAWKRLQGGQAVELLPRTSAVSEEEDCRHGFDFR